MSREQLPQLEGRRVLLAVSGGIAAYKSAELCRLLVRAGANVSVMLTPAARHFVGEATFAALCGRRVATDLFDPAQEAQIGHIRLADDAELLVIAPATADLLARMAHGLANDLVTTVHLAYRGPVLLAPAMNLHMWQHPATQANLAQLQERGHKLVGPAAGEMACGHVGEGRMAEPPEILAAVAECLVREELGIIRRKLAGRRVLVTAGGTREPIDPVRFVGNRSSGRMGFAIAAEARARGAAVVLISGPTELRPPDDVQRVRVTTAAEMADAVMRRADAQDLIVMAAAVADYRPAAAQPTKLKKSAHPRLTLDLEPTQDILAELGRRSPRPVLVGFAAETSHDLDALARAKIASKGCDLLVVNNVLQTDSGFEVETNRVAIHSAEGSKAQLPLLSKEQVAAEILERAGLLLPEKK